ncbi:MAG TPA: hypothetical protein VHS52_07460 [Acidimicrobiales bacterium]|nr:hypothetical protein [Acidimicrobiales bacterium]
MAATAEGVVVRLRWREPESTTTNEMFQVLRLRDGRVVDMADHPNRRTAMKAIGAPSVERA